MKPPKKDVRFLILILITVLLLASLPLSAVFAEGEGEEPTPEPTQYNEPLKISAYDYGWFLPEYDYSSAGITISSECSFNISTNRYTSDISATCNITDETANKQLVIDSMVANSAYAAYHSSSLNLSSSFKNYMKSLPESTSSPSATTTSTASPAPEQSDAPSTTTLPSASSSATSTDIGDNSDTSANATPQPTDKDLDNATDNQPEREGTLDDINEDVSTQTNEETGEVSIALSFKSKFEQDTSLDYIDIWYREKPQETAFHLSDIFFSTAYAADEDWTYLLLNTSTPETNLNLDSEKLYEMYCVANYENGTQTPTYFEIHPSESEVFVPLDVSLADTSFLGDQQSTDVEATVSSTEIHTSLSTASIIFLVMMVLSLCATALLVFLLLRFNRKPVAG